MSGSTRKLRWRLQGRAILLLALVWVLLWGELSLLNVVYGLALGWLVTVVFWLAPIRYYGTVHPGGLIKLAVLQLWDLATASFQLAAIAFRPKLQLRPGVIRVRLASNSDLYQVAVAELERMGGVRPHVAMRDVVDELHAFLDGLALQALLSPAASTPAVVEARLDGYLERLRAAP